MDANLWHSGCFPFRMLEIVTHRIERAVLLSLNSIQARNCVITIP